MDLKETLFNFLYQIAKNNELNVNVEEEGSPIPSCVIPEDKHIFLNYTDVGERKQPLIFAHELGHYLNGDEFHCDYDSVVLDIKREYYADRTGAQLILEGLYKNNIYFSNLYDLMRSCAFSFYLAEDISKMIKQKYSTLIPVID